jgi:hypothetical protein
MSRITHSKRLIKPQNHHFSFSVTKLVQHYGLFENMKKPLLLLLCFVFALQVSAQMQGIRRIRVLDALTREPVVAATVVLEGVPGGYVTDTLGRFELPAKLFGQPETVRIQRAGMLAGAIRNSLEYGGGNGHHERSVQRCFAHPG